MPDILNTRDGKVYRADVAAGVIRISSADSPYLIPSNIHTVWVDAVEGSIDVHLPPPNGSGRRIRVMKIDETHNQVEVEGKRVNGQASMILGQPYEWGLFHDAGDDWFVFQ